MVDTQQLSGLVHSAFSARVQRTNKVNPLEPLAPRRYSKRPHTDRQNHVMRALTLNVQCSWVAVKAGVESGPDGPRHQSAPPPHPVGLRTPPLAACQPRPAPSPPAARFNICQQHPASPGPLVALLPDVAMKCIVMLSLSQACQPSIWGEVGPCIQHNGSQ